MSYYDFAISNFTCARVMLEHTTEYDVIVAHCHSYLEKAIKHILDLDVRKEIPRTNNLVLLADLIGDDTLATYKSFYVEINDYYLTKRYPSPNYKQTTREGCERVYNTTCEIKQYIDKIIRKEN